MNLNYSELKHSCNHIRSQFIVEDQWKFGKVQKIYSSAKVLVMNIRVPGKTVYFSIGRGSDYCGVWDMGQSVPSSHRIQRDKLLEYLRSNLKGKSVIDIRVDEKDRIVTIICHDESEYLFFWKGRRLHFSHIEKNKQQWILFSPWVSMKKETLDKKVSFDVFDNIGRKQLSEKEVRDNASTLDTDSLFSGLEVDSKKTKKIKKKVKLISEDLKKCQLWKQLQDLAVADELDLSGEKLSWKGHRLKFERGSTHYQRRDKLFSKIKKLKKGEEFLSKRLEQAKLELKGHNNEGLVIESMVYPVWVKASKENSTKNEKKDGSLFFEWGNAKIAIGTSAQSNDNLRKVWAKKDDIWLHLDEYKSAHLFVKGISELSLNNLAVLSSILADHSGFEATMIPVIYTKVSNLKGVKGVAGTVNYKKEKHLVLERVNWKEIISSSW